MKLLTLIFALAGLAAAQEKETNRVVPLLHQEPMRLSRILQTYPVTVTVDNFGRTVTLKGLREQLDAAEAVLRQYDVPTPNIELTVYLLSSGSKGADVPASLQAALAPLKAVPGAAAYRVVDTMIVRVAEGQGAQANGRLFPGTSGGPGVTTDLRVRVPRITGEGARRAVRLENFRFSMRVPVAVNKSGQQQYDDVSVNGDYGIPVDKPTLAGRVAMGENGEAAVVVVRATIVE